MQHITREFIQHLAHDLDPEGAMSADELVAESLPLVGLVVMFFNALEKLLDTSICAAVSDRSDALGLLVIHGMQYKAKVDLYERLSDDLHASFASTPAAFGGLPGKLREVGRLRNLVVHADWSSTDAEGFTYVRLKIAAGSMKQEYVQFTPASMERVLAQIREAQSQLDDYLGERDALLTAR